MKHMNWDDLRLLLAVQRKGTIRAAAAACALSPATLSRRLDGLEAAIGTSLLERMPTGCFFTAAGQRVVAWAGQMDEIAVEIDQAPDLHAPAGSVRINTDEWVSYLLTRRVNALRTQYPMLEVEITTTHRPYSLTRREADIGVRSGLPEAGDLITTRIGSLSFGLYGSAACLSEHGAAIRAEDWAHVPFVGFDEPRAHFASERWLRTLPGAPVPWLRCSYALGIYDGVTSGAGLGVLASFVTQPVADLIPVYSDISELKQDLWLSVHRALRESPRIRAVIGWIAGCFRDAR